MPSELKVNKLSPYTGSTLTLGDSGDTISLPSGVSLDTLTITGDLTVDTDTLYVDSANNSVGIGTTSPSTALDVDGTVTATQFVGGGLNAYRNLIINGDMSLAQRGTSVTGLQNLPSYLIDRFSYRRVGTWTTAEYTMSQSTDVPTGQGFADSAKIEVTTAEASVPNDTGSQFAHFLEGQMLQYLKKGTANAESLTLSFWVKSNKTGTYIVQIYDADNSRSISKSYTIDASNTWEKKTITYEGDTTGTLNNDNGSSFQIYWFLAAGTDYTSGTLATSWESYTAANRAVGQVNLADSASNEWYITGVQLEAGTSASDFEFLPYDVNLQRCQRYYEMSYSQGTALGTVTEAGAEMWLANRNPGEPHYYLKFRVTKRANPAITIYNSLTGATGSFRNVDAATNPSAVISRIGHNGSTLYTLTSTTLGQFMQFHYTADAEL